ncbi:unnamed protein product [Orchesella dallaii]|uniref:G-protein coupled receptors family 2 profile 2 domain-containing protein n=1 Tax=Orchesella dallaii TaxID=48710 RepID=A0ABP1QQV4_9HEXA
MKSNHYYVQFKVFERDREHQFRYLIQPERTEREGATTMDNWYLAHVHPIQENSSADEMEMLTEDGMLSLAVVLGSSLSLVGLVFAFITYSLFSDLRSVAGTTLMNLLASLFLTQLLYVVGAGGVQAADLCVSLALALHYSRLSAVCWLLAATHDLYFSVKNQIGLIDCPPPSLLSSFLKYSALGWALPAGLLSGAIFVQSHNGGVAEATATQLKPHNCWFPSDQTFFLTFLIPYWILLAVTIYYVVKGAIAIRVAAAFAPSRKAQEKATRRRRLQLLLFVRIMLYILLVVMSGAAAVFLGWKLAWVIYACGSALQGIFIALSVTCNCQVLKLYTRSLRSAREVANSTLNNYGSAGGMELAKSASLQLLTWEPTPDNV